MYICIILNIFKNWKEKKRKLYCVLLSSGPGPMVNIITTQSGRKPTLCGKPSQNLKDYILEKCKVTDPNRCLFIGDT